MNKTQSKNLQNRNINKTAKFSVSAAEVQKRQPGQICLVIEIHRHK